MEYSWDINKIRNHKLQYKKASKEICGLTKDEKVSIKENIAYFEEMEAIYYHQDFYSFPYKRVKYVDKNHFMPITTFRDYYTISRFIRHTLMDAAKCFKDMENTHVPVAIPEHIFSNEELVEMSMDFFRLLPKKYQQEFNFYTNPHRHLLQFNTHYSDDVKGLTFPFYYPTYRPYFLINKKGDIDDFCTLNHELAHGIFYQNSGTLLDSDSYFLFELEGYFFDFLSFQYLKNIYDEPVVHELEYRQLLSEYDDFISFYLISYATFLSREKIPIDLSRVQRRALCDDFSINLNENILLQTLAVEPLKIAKYGLSFLTSLDLENIYLEDPEYAFSLFEKIRMNPSYELLDDLRKNNITFMDDGYQNLKNKIKTFQR